MFFPVCGKNDNGKKYQPVQMATINMVVKNEINDNRLSLLAVV